MLKIKDYLINKNELLYIEKFGFQSIIIWFKNGKTLEVICIDTDDRDCIFEGVYVESGRS